MGSRWTLVALDHREMRAVPGSTTYRTPGTVSEVSAMLVASTTRRPGWDSNTRCCSARGQPREQRQELGVPGVARVEPVAQVGAQRVVRVADLALAGQEHQDVAGALADSSSHRLADPGHQVAGVLAPGRRGVPPPAASDRPAARPGGSVADPRARPSAGAEGGGRRGVLGVLLVGLGVRGQRPVAHLDGVGAAGDLDHRRAGRLAPGAPVRAPSAGRRSAARTARSRWSPT